MFDPSLTLLSYRLGVAKPSTAIFDYMAKRIENLGIHPEEVLYVGNSPDHDIKPAKKQAWETALRSIKPITNVRSNWTFDTFASLSSILFL